MKIQAFCFVAILTIFALSGCSDSSGGSTGGYSDHELYYVSKARSGKIQLFESTGATVLAWTSMDEFNRMQIKIQTAIQKLYDEGDTSMKTMLRETFSRNITIDLYTDVQVGNNWVYSFEYYKVVNNKTLRLNPSYGVDGRRIDQLLVPREVNGVEKPMLVHALTALYDGTPVSN